MEKSSPWLPIIIGSLTVPASMGLLVFLPEIITLKDNPERNASEWGELTTSTFTLRFPQFLAGLKTSIQKLRSFPTVLILVTYLRVTSEGLAYGQLLMQYVSKRFDRTLADVGYLLTARGISQMLILLVVFPALSKLLSKYMRPAVRDLILGRASACFVIFGTLLTGAPHIGLVISGLILQTSGAGLNSICRSIAMSYMTSRDKSKMNTMIGISETFGSLFAGPALAFLFSLGMNYKAFGLGSHTLA